MGCMRNNSAAWLGVIALALSLTACQHPNKVAAGPPPPLPGLAAAPAVTPPIIAPVVPPVEPPKRETQMEVTPPTVMPPVPAPDTKDVPPATPDKPAVSKPPVRVPPKPPAPTPKNDPPAPAPVPVPQAPPVHIEATLPAAEQSAYRKRAERAILDTQQSLDAIKDARLNRDDQSTLRQAVTFLRDAQKALKAGDLVAAATLAEKSRLLSQELRKRYS